MSGFFTYKRLGQGVCILRRKTLKRAFIVTALRHRHKSRCDKEKMSGMSKSSRLQELELKQTVWMGIIFEKCNGRNEKGKRKEKSKRMCRGLDLNQDCEYQSFSWFKWYHYTTATFVTANTKINHASLLRSPQKVTWSHEKKSTFDNLTRVFKASTISNVINRDAKKVFFCEFEMYRVMVQNRVRYSLPISSFLSCTSPCTAVE